MALSPDERFLYVGDWGPDAKVVIRYELDAAGEPVGPGEVLCELTGASGEDAIDGLAVDRAAAG